MVFQAQQPTDEDKKKKSGDTTQISSGSGAQIGTGGTAAPAGQEQLGSGSFTNIQDYLKANKPKTEQVSKQFSSDIQKGAQKIKTQAAEDKQKYLGEQGLFGQQQKQNIQKAISGAGRATDTPQDKQKATDAFKRLHKGTTEVTDYGKMGSEAKELERKSNLLRTSEGRVEALKNIVGRGRDLYGKGQFDLDQMLLGSDKTSRLKASRESRQATHGLSKDVGELGTNVASAQQEMEGLAQSELASAREAAQTAAKSKYERLIGDIGEGKLSADSLADLGLTRGQTLYGTDVASFVDKTRGMSEAEATRLDELARLGGLEGRELYTAAEAGDMAGMIRESAEKGQQAMQAEVQPLRDQSANLAAQARHYRAMAAAGKPDRWDKIWGTQKHQNYVANNRAAARLEHQANRLAAQAAATETSHKTFTANKDGGVIKDPKKLALKKFRGY